MVVINGPMVDNAKCDFITNLIKSIGERFSTEKNDIKISVGKICVLIENEFLVGALIQEISKNKKIEKHTDNFIKCYKSFGDFIGTVQYFHDNAILFQADASIGSEKKIKEVVNKVLDILKKSYNQFFEFAKTLYLEIGVYIDVPSSTETSFLQFIGLKDCSNLHAFKVLTAYRKKMSFYIGGISIATGIVTVLLGLFFSPAACIGYSLITAIHAVITIVSGTSGIAFGALSVCAGLFHFEKEGSHIDQSMKSLEKLKTESRKIWGSLETSGDILVQQLRNDLDIYVDGLITGCQCGICKKLLKSPVKISFNDNNYVSDEDDDEDDEVDDDDDDESSEENEDNEKNDKKNKEPYEEFFYCKRCINGYYIEKVKELKVTEKNVNIQLPNSSHTFNKLSYKRCITKNNLVKDYRNTIKELETRIQNILNGKEEVGSQ